MVSPLKSLELITVATVFREIPMVSKLYLRYRLEDPNSLCGAHFRIHLVFPLDCFLTYAEAPFNYSKPMTSIPPLQRAVIDLTRSRSSTPDNRLSAAGAESNSTAPPGPRPSIPSNGEPTQQEITGKQVGENRSKNDVFSMGGLADKDSSQVPAPEKSPAPPISQGASEIPARSPPKDQSELERENRHSVDRLLVK